MRFVTPRSLVLLAVLTLLLSVVIVPPSGSAAADPVIAIVELQRAPVGPAAARAARAGAGFDAAAYRAALLADQQALLDELNARGIRATVVTVEKVVNDAARSTVPAQLTDALNAVALSVDADATAAIAAIPGVRAVHPNAPMQAFLDMSVPHIRAPQVWRDLATRGEGQRLAVIDTGIDWTHPMFGGSALPPGALHPKVKYYSQWTPGAPDGHGHGTHVSGIAAGDKDYGQTLTGPALFNGVAPKADLLGIKVLSDAGSGTTLSVVLGIEDAVRNGATVINLSLGSASGNPDSADSRAVNNANDAGVAVAVAAGNSGPGYSTVGSPAAAHKAVTFGASTDPGDNEYFAQLADEATRRGIIPLSNSPIPAANQQSLYADCGLATTPADCPPGTAGKIALIERGGTPFTTKAASAEAAGAIAAIIYNNVPGNFAGTLIAVAPRIPVVAMSQADGQHLKGRTQVVTRISAVEVLLDWQNPRVISDQVAGFSSRGPNDDHVIKPDVVAPGNSITSSVPPVGQLADVDRYSDAGGTSMASPHGAGALALLRAKHPGWTPEWAKTALMNTAVQLTDPADGRLYSVHDQGAGRIDVYAAATTPALFGETYSDGRLARGSVNFGQVETYSGRVTVRKTVVVQDTSGQGGSYSLSWQPGQGKGRGGQGRDLPAAGFDVRLRPSSVSVAANGTSTFTVQLTLDGQQLAPGDYEGRIIATGGGTTLRAPLAVRVSNSGTFGGEAPVLSDPGTINTTGDYTLGWTEVRRARAYRLQEATAFVNNFSDDAEGTSAKWTRNGWSHTTSRAHSGTKSYYSGQSPQRNSTLTTSAPIVLPSGAEATLSFWTYLDTEPEFDFGYVEASSNGGSTWDALAQYDGASDGWVRKTVDLARYAGQSVLLRFRYQTDALIDIGFYEGWYVDDVSVDSGNWRTIAEPNETDYDIENQPNGTYYYRVAALFNDRGFGRRLQGPWSNVVDITVQRQ